MPCFLNFIDLSEQEEQAEILERIASIFGKCVFALSKFDLHMRYKSEIMQFYKLMTGHKTDKIRSFAVFNLPAMLLLYKSVESELNLSFYNMFYEFATNDSTENRITIALCLHEAFLLIKEEEDTSDLRKCFISLILDSDKEIMEIMNRNLSLFIEKWANKHTIDNFKGRTPYYDSEGETTPQSRTSSNNGDNFTSTVNKKKSTMYADEESTTKLTPIFASSEHESEILFSDLLQRLLVFMNRLRSYPGLWREHLQLIRNLNKVIHFFYMPEIHIHVVPMLLEWVAAGNREL